MESWQILTLVVTSVFGMKLWDTLAERWFRKENDHEEAGKTKAEATQIMAKAAETTLALMQSTILSQDKRIQAQDERILRLETKVLQLHAELVAYRTLHGPLDVLAKSDPQSGCAEVHITGDIVGMVE